jgi:acetyl esterase/lipase
MMDMTERLDPELKGPLADLTEATGGGFSLRDIPALRAMVAGMIAGVKAEVPPVEGVTANDHSVPGIAGGPDVRIRVYRPARAAGNLPALIWMHGGGYVLGDLDLDDLMAAQLAVDVGIAVVNVAYRLAPEHPYPAALDDCRAVLQAMTTSAAQFGIDGTRIAVGGASAGGGLAAALALKSREEGANNIVFQLLVYPCINDRNCEQTGAGRPENLFWSRENVLIGWQAYLAAEPGSTDVSVYAAPFRATDLSGLPPAFIGVGQVDMFLPDCLDYGIRLSDAGVGTEIHVYPGAFHAFDAFAPMARVSQQFVRDRNDALRVALSSSA